MVSIKIQLENYLFSKEKHPRCFQFNWFKFFPSWLEYSPTNDEAYCLACYLFSSKSNGHPRSYVFTKQGFKSWKKINAGNNVHLSTTLEITNAMKNCEYMLNQ